MMVLWSTAAAWAVDVQVCVKYDVDFLDSDVSGATEDVFHDNGLKSARGIWIELEASGGSPFGQYAATSGTDAGCADFSLSAATTYDVEVVSEVASTNAHKAYVKLGSVMGQGELFRHAAVSNWTPVAGTYTVTLPVAERWQALAVAGRALLRNTAGRSSLDLDIYVPNPWTGQFDPPSGCPTSASCLDGTDLWLTNADADLKFKTAYYLGWVMLHDMGYDRSSLDKTADDTHCKVSDKSLTMGNLEHTTTGFPQSYAYWYAATVFNFSEDNCSFVFWDDANWDQLEVCHEEMEAGAGHVLSCADGPSLPPYEPIVPDTNYRSYCLDERSPGLAAASKPSDSVSPLDVMRFFWDRSTNDSGLDFEDVGTIIEAGEPWVSTPATYRLALKTQAGTQGGSPSAWATAATEHGVTE